MADHSKAHHHATKAAAAFKSGDGKLGRHHLGHAMMASRHAETVEQAQKPDPEEEMESETADEMVAPSVPAKPAFNRQRFAGMKGAK